MGKAIEGKSRVKKIYYRKLIRDKIPGRIKESGGRFETKILSAVDFKKELMRKVDEEASGLTNAKNKEEIVSEMGDLLDVLREIKKVFGISSKKLINSRAMEYERKGGFKKRIFLIWSEDTGYKTNEKKTKR